MNFVQIQKFHPLENKKVFTFTTRVTYNLYYTNQIYLIWPNRYTDIDTDTNKLLYYSSNTSYS
jgi:hypothetical protein